MSALEIHDTDIDEFLEDYNSRVGDSKRLNFDESRRGMLKTWGDVQACPGSGKTTLVAAKLLILIKKWTETHQGICVITHTNVACDEIRERLHKHPSGYKLTTYPHFIGTIQEFVNKYLGMPYLRGKFQFRRFIDDTEGLLEIKRIQMEDCTVEDICRNLYRTCNRASYNDIKGYLGSLHLLNSDGDLRFFKQNGSQEICRAASNTDRWQMLSKLKWELFKSGIFQYRDMYSFSDKLLIQNEQLGIVLAKRFPIVLVDEMQDTQKFQDDILNKIFSSQDVKLQRLGDPDQAIFDNMGGESPNESFNSNLELEPIKSTHRFDHDISSKISGLSFTQIGEIETLRDTNSENTIHTIFTYSDETKTNVLNRFSEIVEEFDPERKWSRIKAVGATEGSGEYISGYWSGYDRNKSVKNPKPEKLIHIVKCEWWTVNQHSSPHYALLVQGVIDLLRLAGVKDTRMEKPKYFSAQSLSSWLKDNDKQVLFRKLLTKWFYLSDLNSENWTTQVSELQDLLDIASVNDEAENYLAYDDALNIDHEGQYVSKNVFQSDNGRDIEVATIHSVKGETHDATLVLETKFHQFDVKELLGHISLINTNAVSADRKSKFMRQLYVAASRPRSLLCFAVHEDHISQTQQAALESLDWRISSS